MNRTLRIILSILVLIIVAAGGFVGGMFYGQSRSQAQFAARRGEGGAFFVQGGQPGQNGGNRQGTPSARGGFGGGIFGQIQQVGDGVLVIQDQNGKQTQVKVTDTTLIEKNASVPLSELKTGETVIVSGTTGSDGTITARSVQVAPAGRFGAGQPGATPAP
jgi:hypothetical protein